MPAALIPAVVGGALSIGGAIIGGNAQKKAAQTASDTSLAVAQQNNALAKDIYGQNQQALSPFMQRGNAAGNQINALLGIGGQQQPQQQPVSQYGGANGFAPGDQHMGFDGANYGGMNRAGMRDMNPQIGQFANFNPRGTQDGIPMAGVPTQFWSGQQPPQGGISGNQGVVQGQSAQDAANNAFDVFRNSTGYGFRLGEGMNALNSGYAGSGVIQSGAAMRGAQEYGQNFASNEFGNYMNALQNQQGVGLGGASALAGVGQNYAGMVSQNNNAAGTNVANAALVQGANNPWANALGTLGGTILSGGIKF